MMMRQFVLSIALVMGFGAVSVAQNTLLVYTKWPSKLNFIDAFNKIIPFQSVWNEDEGGFEISYEDLENTYVTTSDFASFKLSDQVKLTKLIAMSKDSKISLHQCFTNEKYCCEKLTDKQKKGTEKLYAVALMKKGHKLNLPITFSEGSTQSVIALEDVLLEWKSKLPVKSITILDVNSLKTVYDVEYPSMNRINYSNLEKVKDQFQSGHQYQLSVALEQADKTTVKHHFDFKIEKLSFVGEEYHIPSKEVMEFNWKTSSGVKNVQIVDSASNMNVWSESNYKKNSLRIADIGKSADLLEAGKEYSFIVELDNGEKYSYKFMILLDDEELAALKQIVE